MKAPSEKHLEDYLLSHLGVTVIKRQAKLPHGIADLIVKDDNFLVVVELKKGEIDADAIVQTLRYMGDLRQVYISAKSRWHKLRGQAFETRWNIGYSGPEEVLGMIVGYQRPDDKLVRVCETLGITIMTYDFDGERYKLENHCITELPSMDEMEFYSDLAQGAIGDAFLALMDSKQRVRDRWDAL